jgi:hypothetical protein
MGFGDRYRFWYSELQKEQGILYPTRFGPQYPLFARLDDGRLIEYTECVGVGAEGKCEWSDAVFVGEGVWNEKQ